MGEDVDAAHAFHCSISQGLSAFGRGQVSLDELDALDRVQNSTSSRDHPSTSGSKAIDCRAAQSLAAAADEDALAGELVLMTLAAHSEISKALMASSMSVNRYVKRSGLPLK